MENEHTKEADRSYSFLTTRDALAYFAETDYHLKNGTHIQREYPQPEAIFRFVDNYWSELRQYYADLFQVNLTFHGDNWNKYYFIDFNQGSRGNIALENREYLNVNHIVIGLLFINIYKIDAHIEIITTADFKQVLREDYEEYKQDLYKLLADISGEKDTDYSDKKIDSAIDSAFKAFNKLGWIYFVQQDEFKVMPSFERLRRMYENQIKSIDDIFKTSGVNELPENI